MLVDDNKDVRTVITMGLEHLGYRVIECVDGRNAIERFAMEQPDVSIIDQGLPDIAGIDVGRQIKEMANHPTIIALLTGSDGPDLRRQAREVGFDGFLVKPIKIQFLSEWIDSQIENPDD